MSETITRLNTNMEATRLAHINPISARATPPGATIRREIEERGWTQVQFARILGRPTQYVSELINGKRQLTPETALQLEAALDVPAKFWLAREAQYRLWLQRRSTTTDTEAITLRKTEALRVAEAKKKYPSGLTNHS